MNLQNLACDVPYTETEEESCSAGAAQHDQCCRAGLYQAGLEDAHRRDEVLTIIANECCNSAEAFICEHTISTSWICVSDLLLLDSYRPSGNDLTTRKLVISPPSPRQQTPCEPPHPQGQVQTTFSSGVNTHVSQNRRPRTHTYFSTFPER